MTDTPSPTLGRRLRHLRCQAGLTVYELARRAEVHASYIWRLEKSERTGISLEVARRLAGVIGCRIDEFYTPP